MNNHNTSSIAKSTNPQEPTVEVPTQTLAQIYNLLYSIEVKGESVKTMAFIEQIIEGLLNPTPNEVK